jgi:DNA-binding transcriptional MerR regulator
LTETIKQRTAEHPAKLKLSAAPVAKLPSFTIKQVSEKTSLPPHVLRYYENEGLLPSVARSRNGIRRYSENDLEWLGLICCLKNTGMPIKKIKNFVELSVEGDGTLKERCELLKEHKKTVEAQIQEMHKHLEKVTKKIEHFTRQYEKYTSGR